MHIMDQIRYPFLNISICDLLHFYGYCILVFVFLRRATDIRIFLFQTKMITSQIKIYGYFFLSPMCMCTLT